MSFQEIIGNTWSKEEVDTLTVWSDKTLDFLVDIFAEKKFNRTKEAIARKRRKLLKQIENRENVIVDKILPKTPIEPEQPKVLLVSTPREENLFYKKFKENKFVGGTTLVLPDSHVMPGMDMTRFSKVGDLIVDRKPTRIVLMGDFVTLESLSAWDLGKAGKMEGKRYSEDCKAGIQAIDLMLSPLRKLQLRQIKAKEKVYEPRIVYLLGNHEDRLARYVSTKPELAEHLEISKDLQLEESGFTDVIPYRGFIEFDGVLFTHAVMNAANLAIGGKTALATIAQSVSKSVVIGHLHRLETVNHYRHGADDIIQILSTGCFFDGVEDYADGGLNAYYRGLVLLTHWKDGRFDIETIATPRLMEMY